MRSRFRCDGRWVKGVVVEDWGTETGVRCNNLPLPAGQGEVLNGHLSLTKGQTVLHGRLNLTTWLSPSQ